MSNTIDNRAVQLGFDNKQFESGVKTSVESLDKLKKGLDLNEQAKSLQNLSNAGKSFNLSNISDGVQSLANRFSAFGIIGMTVLQNLTNAAIQFGQKLWASIVSPAKKGFNEYEIQMNAIQTIMANTASKGTTLEQVNAVLEELNLYADKTIYNFAEMAKNIGTFTAAGVDLQTSAAAIKGIGNLAAISGSNSQQASTAMYQLSQALASGTVRLMDWNSVNSAGMGGEVFKNALIESARVHGIAIDSIIKKEGSFRESLSTGWLSSSILTETLAKFTGDLSAEQLRSIGYTEEQIIEIQKLGEMANDAATKVKTLSQLKETLQEGLSSGWARTWQLIAGDFEEAKAFFTYLSETFGGLVLASSNARNEVLQGWKNFGGRELAVEALKNVLESILNMMKTIGSAWSEIFPKEKFAGWNLKEITMSIRDFTKNLQMGSGTALRVKAIFKGLFAIFDIGVMAIKALLGGFTSINTSGLKPFLSNMLVQLSMWAMYPIKLRDAIKATDGFGVAIQRIKTFISDAKASIIAFINAVKLNFSKFGVSVTAFTESFKSFGTIFKELFGPKNFDVTKINSFFEKIKLAFAGLLSSFSSLTKIDLSGVTTFLTNYKIRFDPLINFFNNLASTLKEKRTDINKSLPDLSGIKQKITDFLSGIGTAINDGLKGVKFDNVKDIANIGLLAILVKAITGFLKSGSGIGKSIIGMFEGFAAIPKGIVGILDSVRGCLVSYQKSIQAKTLLTIAIAIGILAISLIALSMVDSGKLTVALVAVTAMFADLVISMNALSNIGGKGIGGVVGLTVTLVGISLALLLLSAAVRRLSEIDPEEIKTGLLALTAISAGLVVFSQTMTSGKDFIGTALSLIILGFALQQIINVIKDIGTVKPEVVKNGLIAIGATLAELSIFMKISSTDKMGVSKGAGLLLISKGILLLADAVYEFGNMDLNVLKQGLITLGAILVALGAFTKLTGNGANLLTTAVGIVILSGGLLLLALVIQKMGNFTWDEIGKGLAALASSLLVISIAMYAMQGALPGAVSLLIVAAALTLLVPVLKALGAMNISQVAIALGVLAGVFLVIGIAGLLLTPLVPVLLALALAIGLLGIAVAAIGGGVLLFSAGMAALAVSGAAGAIALTAIITTLLGILPLVITAVVAGMVLFATLIAQQAPIITNAFGQVIISMLTKVIEIIPLAAKAFTALLQAIFQVIRDNVPTAVDTFLYVLGEMLKSIALKIPEFVQAAFDMLIGFLKGIRDNIGEVVTVAIEIVTEFIDAVAAKLPDIIKSGFNLLISFIEGITKAVKDQGPELMTAIGDLAKAIIKGLTDGLLGGIGEITKAIGKIGSGIISALKTLLGIASPSTVTYAMGRNLDRGFANGLIKDSDRVESAAKKMGNKAILGMNSAISRINDALNSNLDMNPVIRPVVDLTNVEGSGRSIDSIFGNKGIQLSGSMNNLSLAAARMNQNGSGTQINQAEKTGTIITFNQTNTSPKALSPFEIYRETRNQLLMLKGLVISE
jgi:tape measure domain-containing protein